MDIPFSNNKGAIKQQICRVFDEFVAVQAQNCDDLIADKLKHVMLWRHKREHVFNRLKQYLDLVDSDFISKNDRDFLADLRKRLQDILEGEDLLYAKAEQKREELARRLDTLRKGKKALQGYSLKNTGMAPKPKFLSNRT